jgi:hypothetical protein
MRGGLADLNMLNDPVNLPKFREIGPAAYMPHCYRPGIHYPRTGPRDPGRASDLAFIGTAFPSRRKFFEAMDLSGLDVLIAGNDWGKTSPDSPLVPFIGTGLTDADCVNNDEAAEIYRHAKMGINFYRREAEDGWDTRAYACGPREIEMAACGLPFLRDPRGEGDELLHMLPRYGSPEEASELLRWHLAREGVRDKIGAQAREAVADRTFENNVKRFLRLIEDL